MDKPSSEKHRQSLEVQVYLCTVVAIMPNWKCRAHYIFEGTKLSGFFKKSMS